MFRQNENLVSSSARKLPVKMRPDLTVKRQFYLGRSYWTVKEPIGSKFIRFQDEEYALLKKFDGKHSLDDIKQEFENEYPPQKISLEEIHRLIGQFHQTGLVVTSAPNQGIELLKRRKKRFRRELLQKCSNILAIKFKGFEPDRLLDFLYPFFSWCFHPLTVFLSIGLGIAALPLVR
ncbi:hypothetical protein FACS189419_10140 [Planctomycetales bacterium]|nr:hypothetical protein FACS189419_10140 [Planctomycetales bacterium]